MISGVVMGSLTLACNAPIRYSGNVVSCYYCKRVDKY